MLVTSLAAVLSSSTAAYNDMWCVHEVAYLVRFNKRSCDGIECQVKMGVPRMETQGLHFQWNLGTPVYM